MATGSGSMSYNGFGIILTILILYWLFKIDKCPCTHIPEGKYLKEWFIIDIIFSISLLIYVLANNNLKFSNVLLFVALIITLINLIMIIRLLIYIHKLKEIKCDCGLSKLENFIYYWYIVAFSLILFIILLGLIYYLFL